MFIKWEYLIVGDEEFNELIIHLKNSSEIVLNKNFKRKYPELHHILFQEIEANTLKLQFPKSYYLDIRSNTQRDKILRRFINDDRDTDPKEIKPIELANECYPIEVYKWFAFLIGLNTSSNNNEFGSLTLGFNDTKGYVCNNGNESHEISITISEKGVKWEWWPNR